MTQMKNLKQVAIEIQKELEGVGYTSTIEKVRHSYRIDANEYSLRANKKWYLEVTVMKYDDKALWITINANTQIQGITANQINELNDKDYCVKYTLSKSYNGPVLNRSYHIFCPHDDLRAVVSGLVMFESDLQEDIVEILNQIKS